MTWWQELWQRVSAVQPVPSPEVVAMLGAMAFALAVLAWPVTRMLVTITHEASHAVVAAMTGRQLTGIRLHSDTSGLTVSRGKPKGPGMVATLFAGYTGPALVGLGAAWVLSQGYAVALLWGWAAMLTVMLLFIRNFYGLLTMLVVGGGVTAASWYLEPVHQSWLAYLLTWFLLLAAPRAVVELARTSTRGSDSAQLARITPIGVGGWNVAFGIVTVGCLLGGVAILVPGVVAAIR